MRIRLRLVLFYIRFPLYILHYIIYVFSNNRNLINEDVQANSCHYFNDKCRNLVYLLQEYKYFRSLFYFRIGYFSFFLKWYLPGDPTFLIAKECKLGGGIILHHPFSTVINAKTIGSNFECRNNTTIGNKSDTNINLLPVIGKNVIAGANCCIIGDIEIGDNVIIGAGSVVVKNVPNNVIVAGNPAKIIKENKP